MIFWVAAALAVDPALVGVEGADGLTVDRRAEQWIVTIGDRVVSVPPPAGDAALEVFRALVASLVVDLDLVPTAPPRMPVPPPRDPIADRVLRALAPDPDPPAVAQRTATPTGPTPHVATDVRPATAPSTPDAAADEAWGPRSPRGAASVPRSDGQGDTAADAGRIVLPANPDTDPGGPRPPSPGGATADRRASPAPAPAADEARPPVVATGPTAQHASFDASPPTGGGHATDPSDALGPNAAPRAGAAPPSRQAPAAADDGGPTGATTRKPAPRDDGAHRDDGAAPRDDGAVPAPATEAPAGPGSGDRPSPRVQEPKRSEGRTRRGPPDPAADPPPVAASTPATSPIPPTPGVATATPQPDVSDRGLTIRTWRPWIAPVLDGRANLSPGVGGAAGIEAGGRTGWGSGITVIGDRATGFGPNSTEGQLDWTFYLHQQVWRIRGIAGAALSARRYTQGGVVTSRHGMPQITAGLGVPVDLAAWRIEVMGLGGRDLYETRIGIEGTRTPLSPWSGRIEVRFARKFEPPPPSPTLEENLIDEP